jgi:uncharacterized integral membrane protein
MLFTLILGFVLGAAAIAFVLQNTAIVALTFVNWQFEASLALVVIISILVGFVLTLLVMLPGSIGNSLRMRRLRKHAEALAAETEHHKQVAETATSELHAAQNNGNVVDLTR